MDCERLPIIVYVDFDQSFITVVKLMVFQVFFTIVVLKKISMNKIDIKMPFSIRTSINCSILNFLKTNI